MIDVLFAQINNPIGFKKLNNFIDIFNKYKMESTIKALLTNIPRIFNLWEKKDIDLLSIDNYSIFVRLIDLYISLNMKDELKNFIMSIPKNYLTWFFHYEDIDKILKLLDLNDLKEIYLLNIEIKELLNKSYPIHKLKELFLYDELYILLTETGYNFNDIVNYFKKEEIYNSSDYYIAYQKLADIKNITLNDYISLHNIFKLDVNAEKINNKFTLRDLCLWFKDNKRIPGITIGDILVLNKDKLSELEELIPIETLYLYRIVSLSKLYELGVPLKNVVKMIPSNMNIELILESGYTLKELVESKQYNQRFYPEVLLRDKVVSLKQLKEVGVKITDIGEFSNIERNNNKVEYDYQKLIEAGYTPLELKEAGMTNIRFLFDSKAPMSEIKKAYTTDEIIKRVHIRLAWETGEFTYKEIKPLLNDEFAKKTSWLSKNGTAKQMKANLEERTKECKKNWKRHTNLLCKYDPQNNIAVNIGELYD